MPSPVSSSASSLQSVAVSSSSASIGPASPELLLERLFSVRNQANQPFKTETHKVRYPGPRVGLTAFVARRDHPGRGLARAWHRARDLCSASASERRLRSNEKVHLSVVPDQLGQAYQCVSAMLTDDNCPIDDFKVVNPAMADVDESTSAGGQVTFYIHDQTDPRAVRYFLIDLGSRLDEAGVTHGSIPASDRPLNCNNQNQSLVGEDTHLRFFSYRNEDMHLEDGQALVPELQTDFYRELCAVPRRT